MMEAECRLAILRQALPIIKSDFEKWNVPTDIRLDECGWPIDRAIDMALGGEMHHDIGPELGEERAHGGHIANIELSEMEMRALRHGLEIFEIACVSQLVEDANLMARSPIRCRTTAEPINPAPPVTKKRFMIKT